MARTVVYGTNRLTVEDDTQSVQAIKASVSEVFPELANADFEVKGNEIHFSVKAGTKGARTVVYGTNRLTVEDDTQSVQAIKASVSEVFPELANADFEVKGNEIHFSVKAGTKGLSYTLVVDRTTGEVIRTVA